MVKMDIEGAEMLALPKMLRDGTLCRNRLDSLVLEFHPDLAGSINPEFDLGTFKKKLERQQGCKPTLLVDLDDETFLHDGMPLPCYA